MTNIINLNGKSYKELSYSEPIPVEKIRKLYDGYWVLIVNAEFSSGRSVPSG